MKTDLLDLRQMDCMEMMAQYPDNHFDLAIVDPPYGIGMDGGGVGGSKRAAATQFAEKEWDKEIPKTKYFEELFRVSRHQIIWGANYMIEKIAKNSSSWIVWDKNNGATDFADAELAYASHKKPVRIFRFTWSGMVQGDMKNKETRIHPTQKPVKLYSWILSNYAKPGDKILDTHMGSGSIAIACHYARHHLTACELDADYFSAACARIDKETRQESFIY